MKIITILPGFDRGSYAWLNDDYDGGRLSYCIADAINGFRHVDFKVSRELEQGFASWMVPLGLNEHVNPGFSWKEYHREGIAFTRRLKAEISTRTRVLYLRPSADPDNASERYVEFLNNGSMIYVTSPQRRWRPHGPC